MQAAPSDSNTYLCSGLVENNTITWAKGEVLGKGAYGTVSIKITLQLLTFADGIVELSSITNI